MSEGNMLLCDQTNKNEKATTQKNFLADPDYKQYFIKKSSNVLKENLFETLHAADCLIVGTTLKLAKQTATNALVG